jgi:hypothetical protein
MLAQFKTQDGAQFQVDTENLTWSQTDAEIPSGGELNYQGNNLFSMAGRTPDSPAPGAGLCTIFTTCLAVGQEIIIFLRANVEITEFTLARPIKSVRYEILSGK